MISTDVVLQIFSKKKGFKYSKLKQNQKQTQHYLESGQTSPLCHSSTTSFKSYSSSLHFLNAYSKYLAGNFWNFHLFHLQTRPKEVFLHQQNIKNINAFKQRHNIEHLEDIPFWIQSFPCMRNCLPLNTAEQFKFQLIAQAFLQLQHSSWNNDTQACKSGLLHAHKSLIRSIFDLTWSKYRQATFTDSGLHCRPIRTLTRLLEMFSGNFPRSPAKWLSVPRRMLCLKF